LKGKLEDKPQLKFKDPPDNSEDYPYIPKISQKYNSEIPLNEKIYLAKYNPIEFFKNIVKKFETYLNLSAKSL